MIVLKGNNLFESGIGNICLTLGVFDGVHIGHKYVLEKTKQVSLELGLKSTVITLHPDPEKILNPQASFTVLTPISKRIDYFKDCGLNYCFILDVDRNVLSYSADKFFMKFIYENFKPCAIVVGEDFRFGRNKEGDVLLLKEYAEHYKFQLYSVSLLNMFGEKVSSSKVREALAEGDIEKTKFLLGRFPELSGMVVSGEGRGRRLGFPTANLLLDYEFQLAKGVYIGDAVLKDDKIPALLYVGTSPSFGGRLLRYEIYIPSFSGLLYGKNITFLVRDRLRDEKFFRDKDEIQRQLQTDRENLIRYLASQSRI